MNPAGVVDLVVLTVAEEARPDVADLVVGEAAGRDGLSLEGLERCRAVLAEYNIGQAVAFDVERIKRLAVELIVADEDGLDRRHAGAEGRGGVANVAATRRPRAAERAAGTEKNRLLWIEFISLPL